MAILSTYAKQRTIVKQWSSGLNDRHYHTTSLFLDACNEGAFILPGHHLYTTQMARRNGSRHEQYVHYPPG